jgi:serine protease Do
MKLKNLLIALAAVFLVFASIVGGAIGDRLLGYNLLDQWFPEDSKIELPTQPSEQVQKKEVVKEESVIIDIVDNASPSVVTVGVKKTQQVFDPFSFFGGQQFREESIERDIGSGFVISSDGMVVTNKHVVADPEAEYNVITKDDQEYQVQKIYRDPGLDLAILKIDASGLNPLKLGNSDNIQVGQLAVAIGTALGEFRNTVTTGVISGVGRGVSAGSPFGGFSENLENVIQTDAAINPGNSGGPLLNSAGEVIGVNWAVSQGAENIGFAIPINIVKSALDNFEETGSFSRAFLGVSYKMISRDVAVLNEIPQGAYVADVVEDSAAEEAGIEAGDIITEFAGKNVRSEEGGLAKLIQEKKPGDTVEVEIWREGERQALDVTLKEMGN